MLHYLWIAPQISSFCFHLQDFNKENIKADDSIVVRALRERFLVLPSRLPYNLSQPEEENPSMGQAQRIDYILKGKVRCIIFKWNVQEDYE